MEHSAKIVAPVAHAQENSRPTGTTSAAREAIYSGNGHVAVAQRKLAGLIAQSPRVAAQQALSDRIHQSPRVVAQEFVLRRASSPSATANTEVVQRYTANADGSKTSEGGVYVTHETGHVDAKVGHTVDQSQRTGPVNNGYQRWAPLFNVIGDCAAAAEELMHGKKLKYGVPRASVYRDSKSKLPFGDSDSLNRSRGRLTDRGHDADPSSGQAFLITRQNHARGKKRPQFHAATVVARDGADSVTLEATAPTRGNIADNRVQPIYDMYGTAAKKPKQTFKIAYQGEYGEDAAVSVLEAAKRLPAKAKAPANSEKIEMFE